MFASENIGVVILENAVVVIVELCRGALIPLVRMYADSLIIIGGMKTSVEGNGVVEELY